MVIHCKDHLTKEIQCTPGLMGGGVGGGEPGQLCRAHGQNLVVVSSSPPLPSLTYQLTHPFFSGPLSSFLKEEI